MNSHTKIVASLYIAFGILSLIAAVVVFGALGLVGTMAISQGEEEAAGILGIIGFGISGFLTLLALPDIIGGWALYTGRSWGRPVIIVLGVLNLINIPIGTALGVYTLWALLKEKPNR